MGDLSKIDISEIVDGSNKGSGADVFGGVVSRNTLGFKTIKSISSNIKLIETNTEVLISGVTITTGGGELFEPTSIGGLIQSDFKETVITSLYWGRITEAQAFNLFDGDGSLVTSIDDVRLPTTFQINDLKSSSSVSFDWTGYVNSLSQPEWREYLIILLPEYINYVDFYALLFYNKTVYDVEHPATFLLPMGGNMTDISELKGYYCTINDINYMMIITNNSLPTYDFDVGFTTSWSSSNLFLKINALTGLTSNLKWKSEVRGVSDEYLKNNQYSGRRAWGGLPSYPVKYNNFYLSQIINTGLTTNYIYATDILLNTQKIHVIDFGNSIEEPQQLVVNLSNIVVGNYSTFVITNRLPDYGVTGKSISIQFNYDNIYYCDDIIINEVLESKTVLYSIGSEKTGSITINSALVLSINEM